MIYNCLPYSSACAGFLFFFFQFLCKEYHMHPKLTPLYRCNKRKKERKRGNEIMSLHFWKQSYCMSQRVGHCCFARVPQQNSIEKPNQHKKQFKGKNDKQSEYRSLCRLMLCGWSLFMATYWKICYMKNRDYTLKIKDGQQFQDRFYNNCLF